MDQKTHDKGLEIRKAVLACRPLSIVSSFRVAREVFAEIDKA